MPRITVNRSISFDPELFEKMETRRQNLLMQRSEYITRLILRDMMGEKPAPIVLNEMPANFLPNKTARDRSGEKRGTKKKH